MEGINSHIGTHHAVSPQHLQKYSDESAFKYNRKDVSPAEIFNAMVGNAERERTVYSALTSEWEKLIPED